MATSLTDELTDIMRRHLDGTLIDQMAEAARAGTLADLMHATTEDERWRTALAAIAALQSCVLSLAKAVDEHAVRPHGATRA